MRKTLYFVIALSLLSVSLAAQVHPAAKGAPAGLTFWVGASISTFNPDYGCDNSSPFSCGEHQLIGVGPYLDTSPFLFDRIGLEGEVRLMLFHGPATLIENSYMGGPRVRIFRYKNLAFTGKFLVGEGTLDVPSPALGGGSYFAYAPGAAIDNRLTEHVAIRFEYEYQRWPGFPPFKGGSGGAGGLTPNGFSFGVSYAFHSARAGSPTF